MEQTNGRKKGPVMRSAIILLACLCSYTSVTALEFIVYGDTRSFPNSHKEVLTAMCKTSPALVLNIGDLADGYQSQFISILQSYPKINTLLSANKYLVAKGSDAHDAESWVKGLRPTVLRDNALRYAFTEDDCFIVSNGTDATADTWLSSTLGSAAAKAARHRIIFQHTPIYSSGKYVYGGNAAFEQICALHDVSLVFSGHSHHYERSKVMKTGTSPVGGNDVETADGTVYVITGGGGAELNTMQSQPASYTQNRFMDHHFCQIITTNSGLTLKAINKQSQVVDMLTWTRGAPVVNESRAGAYQPPKRMLSTRVTSEGLYCSIRSDGSALLEVSQPNGKVVFSASASAAPVLVPRRMLAPGIYVVTVKQAADGAALATVIVP